MLSPLARQDVESAILQMPDVSNVAILDQYRPDGERQSVAFVTMSTAPHSEAQKSLSDFRRSRISQWKTIFDFTYKPKSENSAPNFIGWRSSDTNKAIPAAEMQEWLERTCERILSYKPKRILEIGCGVGLLLERLAPHCASYTGTDVSAAAISRLRDFVAARSEYQHVNLLERDASNFEGFRHSDFDMVVINSVVQYFPELGYLEQVLSSATQTLAEGGRIFVGDIRNLSLQTAFHTQIQLAKVPDAARVDGLKDRISLMEQQERELVIDPQFFLNFSQSHPRLARAEMLVKRGRARNEMINYRYDAVLHLDAATPSPPQRTWAWSNTLQLSDLIAQCGRGDVECVRIEGVPNARVETDREAWRLLAGAAGPTLVGAIREKLDKLQPTGVDPEALFEAAEAAGCDIRVEARPRAADGSFDVAILGRGVAASAAETLPLSEGAEFDDTRPVSTDPLWAAHKQQIANGLWAALRERIPHGDLPVAIQVVDYLPPTEAALSVG